MKKLLLITLLTLGANQAFSASRACPTGTCNDLINKYNNLVTQYAPSEDFQDCSNTQECPCYLQNQYATLINNLVTKYNLFTKYKVYKEALEVC